MLLVMFSLAGVPPTVGFYAKFAVIQAAVDAGFDPAAGLAAADAGRVLEAAGDVVHTGPTGTNVGDLVIGLKVSEPEALTDSHQMVTPPTA